MRHRQFLVPFWLAAALAGAAPSAVAAPTAGAHTGARPCAALARALPRGASNLVARDSAPADVPQEARAALAGLATVCRVSAVLHPVAGSAIGIELWLPESGWNGLLLAVGNGGWAGHYDWDALARGVRQGYAVVATDTGHQGDDTAFVAGAGPALRDFSDRAVHVMTIAARALVRARYGRGPRYAYFAGCSTGGWQGLRAAQRHPADFDGIVAGSPDISLTHEDASYIWNLRAMQDGAGGALDPPALALLRDAMLGACDALDGSVDGVIGDPERCRADPQLVRCASPSARHCLRAAQVEAARRIYAGAVDPRSGRRLAAGFERGSEAGWQDYGDPQATARLTPFYIGVLTGTAPVDFRSVDLTAALARADAFEAGAGLATGSDLHAFVARGGRLLIYHGWADGLLAPRATIDFYRRALADSGARGASRRAVRLFMVPGMGHCGGGDAPTQFDALGALRAWREQGRAPARIVAAQLRDGHIVRTRPLCPYPQLARVTDGAHADEAAAYDCRNPRGGQESAHELE